MQPRTSSGCGSKSESEAMSPRRGHGGLQALRRHRAARDAHDEELALAVRVRQRHDDVLQRVASGPGAVLAWVPPSRSTSDSIVGASGVGTSRGAGTPDVPSLGTGCHSLGVMHSHPGTPR